MSNIIRGAKGGQNESDSLSGPSSYTSGGFSQRSDMGRVDNVTADVDNLSLDTRVSIADNNAIVFEVFSESSASEISAGHDLSGDTFTYDAYRL